MLSKKILAIFVIILMYIIYVFNSCFIFRFFTNISEKNTCNKTLKEFNTPKQEIFNKPILKLPHTLKYPVVVKPDTGFAGKNVYVNIKNDTELYKITKSFKEKYVVEEHIFKKNEYRILINKHLNIFTIMHRSPIHVIGDGIHNIQELAKKKDKIKSKTIPLYHKIIIDERVVNKMRIPIKNEYVIVNMRKNKSQGSTLTIIPNSKIHPDNVDYMYRILKKTNLSFAGIDILTNDLSVSYKQEPIVLIEINLCPGFTTFPRHYVPLLINSFFIGLGALSLFYITS